ncbi:MAG TPA: hypothetical protein VKZ45_02645 [Vicingaceae bacterium]|nr:hypothetical protein [Vicingaceae bacterium]
MKKYYLLSIAISTITLFNSCEKEKLKELNTVKTHVSNEVYNSSLSRLVERNDFEKFGLLHNSIIIEMGNNPNLPNLTRRERFELASSIILNKGLVNNQTITWGEMNHFMGLINGLNATNSVDKIIQNSSFTENERIALERIMGLLFDLKNAQFIPTPDEFSSSVYLIENEILEQYEVEYDATTNIVNNAGKLLVATSIARHSYNLWYDVAINENNPWHFRVVNGRNDNNGNNGNNQRCGFFCKIKNAIDFVIDDIRGALEGPRPDPTDGLGGVNANATATNAAMYSVVGN